ncbi:MAG TPA: hypothetical protein VF331_23070 [Polyangiales bacterium]
MDEHKAYLYGLAAGDPRPALLDQMGFGSCVLVRDSKVNLEVIDGAGESLERHRPVAALRPKLQEPLAAPQRVEALRPPHGRSRSRLVRAFLQQRPAGGAGGVGGPVRP